MKRVLCGIFTVLLLMLGTACGKKEPVPDGSGVSIAVKEGTLDESGATFVWTNSSPFEYTHGNPFELERVKEDGTVEAVELIRETYFYLDNYALKAGETSEHEIRWVWLYGELPAGKYRYKTEFTYSKEADDSDEYDIFAEFTLEARDIEMAVKEGSVSSTGVTLMLSNTSQYEYTCGMEYRLEQRLDEEWKAVEPIDENYAFTEIGVLLPAGKTQEMLVDWEELYGELTPGRYRISKDFSCDKKTGAYTCAAEFVLPTGGSGVSMTVKEETLSALGATVVWTNSSQYEYTFGESFELERVLEDGTVEPMEPIIEDVFFHAIGYPVKAGETREHEVEWGWIYGKLPAGKYRIKTDFLYSRESGDFDKYDIFVEFTLKARDVEMAVKEGSVSPTGVTLMLSNTAQYDCTCGMEYRLEQRLIDGWEAVAMDDEVKALGLVLPAGKTQEMVLDWGESIKLAPGRYRIKKEFSCADEPNGYMLIAEFILPPDGSGVSLAIKEGTLYTARATLVWTNNSEYHYTYGSSFELERVLADGTVEPMEPIIENYAFDDLRYSLFAGETTMQSVDWERLYGKLAPGQYRITKKLFYDNGRPDTNREYPFTVEFTIG
ncbi:hypothetical protein LJB83_02095 [Clostridia bacterium OttesenSCG-928-F22]|nr:hypothetical protein [Clostridia bacterium OttesenSCG-928-F22]